MIKGLPEKLKDLRERQRISQRVVAKRLGVSASIISGYETGERTPSAEVLLALSYLYGCSTDYLLGREVNAPKRTLDVSGLTEKQILLISELLDTMR